MAKAAAAAKKRTTKKPAKGADPESQEPIDAQPGEEPQKLKIGRSNVSPETKLEFFNRCRIKLAAAEKVKKEYDSLVAEYRAELKKAKAAGVDKDAIIEVLKLKKLQLEEIAINFEAINEMMVLTGMAIPVKNVSADVTIYATQLGFFDDGKSVATKVDDAVWNASNPEHGSEAPMASNKVSTTEIAGAKALGYKAGDKGFGADKNPYLKNGLDDGHPLVIAWETSRADRTAERVRQELAQPETTH